MEHLHAELLVAGERIVQLRADLDRKAADEKEAKSEVCRLGAKLARVMDSMDGPNRILLKKICRLKRKIRLQQVLGYGDDDDGGASVTSDDDNNKVDGNSGDGMNDDCI